MMDITNKNEMLFCEKEVASLLETLNGIRNDIIIELKPFLAKKLTELVKEEISGNTDHTNKLGKETLAKMKAEFSQILENLEANIDTLFSDDMYWMHINYHPVCDEYGNYPFRNENRIIRGVKKLLGLAGKLLIKYDYTDSIVIINIQESFRNDKTHNWVSESNGDISYRWGVSYSSHIEKLIKSYNDSMSELHTKQISLDRYREKLKKQQSLDMWDDA